MDLIITILPVVTKDLPISPRFTPDKFFFRDASSALLQLVNQWLNFTYYYYYCARAASLSGSSGRILPLLYTEYRKSALLLAAAVASRSLGEIDLDSELVISCVTWYILYHVRMLL